MSKDKIRAIDSMIKKDFIEAPHKVYCVLGAKRIVLSGRQACVGGDNSDFASIEDIRAAIDWLANQMGGKVIWEEYKLED